jgi:hypothetical protein
MRGEDNLDALARQARDLLKTCPATGCYEEHEHENLWDEFCYWTRIAPDGLPSSSAWEATIDPFVDQIAETVSETGQENPIWAAEVEVGDCSEADGGEGSTDGVVRVDRRLLKKAIRRRLDALARWES